MMEKYDESLRYNSETQIIIGNKKRTLIDQETGEIFNVDQITKRVLGQKQFWKIYLLDFLQILGSFEYKQLDVLIYIIDNVEQSNNTFIGTFRKISEKSGISFSTVARTIALLQERGFMKKIQNGVYQISPEIIMKGSDHKKQLLLNYYEDKNEVKEYTEKQPEIAFLAEKSSKITQGTSQGLKVSQKAE